eukprot:4582473-Amphidinium_carterae.1
MIDAKEWNKLGWKTTITKLTKLHTGVNDPSEGAIPCCSTSTSSMQRIAVAMPQGARDVCTGCCVEV